MPIQARAKLLDRLERINRSSEGGRTLPSLFLRQKISTSLTWRLNLKIREGKITSKTQRLQEYNFEIRHYKEALHLNADALSRCLCIESYLYSLRVEKKYDIKNPIAR